MMLKIYYRKVCRFIPRQERKKYGLSNIFIKNFGENFTDSQLREAFASFGTISSATVEKNEDGQGKGFGFVCYESPEAAAKVCKWKHDFILLASLSGLLQGSH